MAVNKFRPRKFEDFEIVNGNEKVVGACSRKAKRGSLAPSNSHVWHGVSLDVFADFMENKWQETGKIEK